MNNNAKTPYRQTVRNKAHDLRSRNNLIEAKAASLSAVDGIDQFTDTTEFHKTHDELMSLIADQFHAISELIRSTE